MSTISVSGLLEVKTSTSTLYMLNEFTVIFGKRTNLWSIFNSMTKVIEKKTVLVEKYHCFKKNYVTICQLPESFPLLVPSTD